MKVLLMLAILSSLILASCGVSPNETTLTSGSSPTLNSESVLNKGDSVISAYPLYAVVFDRLRLYLSVGSYTSGTITVEIRNSNGSTVLASSVRNASSLYIGNGWNTFRFTTVYLNPLEKYRIYVTRSDGHNYNAGNYIFWRTSSGGNNAYPQGINDVYPSWNLDYAFITYSSGYVDQQQLNGNYGFAVANSYYRWQEFVPDRAKTAFTRFNLLLDTGANTTGNINVQIRNADGTAVLWANSLNADTYLVNGNAWNTFWVNSLSLYIGDKYRIYVTRTGEHNYPAGNYIFWRTSSGGNDAYPAGVNDVYPSWVLDYAFITYANGVVDQQQANGNYGFGVPSSYYRWQEFIFKN